MSILDLEVLFVIIAASLTSIGVIISCVKKIRRSALPSTSTKRRDSLINIMILVVTTVVTMIILFFNFAAIVENIENNLSLIIIDSLLILIVVVLTIKIIQTQNRKRQSEIFATIIQLCLTIFVLGITFWLSNPNTGPMGILNKSIRQTVEYQLDENAKVLSDDIKETTESNTKAIQNTIVTTADGINSSLDHITQIIGGTSAGDGQAKGIIASSSLLGNGITKYESEADKKKTLSTVAQGVADRHFDLGINRYKALDLHSSKRIFVQTYRMYKKLAKSEPTIYNRALAMTKYNIGTIDLDLQKQRDAVLPITWGTKQIVKSYEESLERFCVMNQAEPNSYHKYVELVLLRMGSVYFEKKFEEILHNKDKTDPIREIIKLMGTHRYKRPHKKSVETALTTLRSCGPKMEQYLKDNEIPITP